MSEADKYNLLYNHFLLNDLLSLDLFRVIYHLTIKNTFLFYKIVIVVKQSRSTLLDLKALDLCSIAISGELPQEHLLFRKLLKLML